MAFLIVKLNQNMTKQKFNYSKALTQLKKILQSLEEGNIPIEKLHKQVAEAQTLIQACKQHLRKIEEDVQGLLDEES